MEAGTGTDLERRDESSIVRPPSNAPHALALIRDTFTAEDRTAVAAYHEVPAEAPAMTGFLAVCATYGFDPIIGGVYVIPKKKSGRNASGEKKYGVMVGRDALLSVARRTPEWRGIPSGVVCERDEFSVEWTGDPMKDPIIRHVEAPKPTSFETDEKGNFIEDPGRWRGRVLGAWSKLLVEGKTPVYYYASTREHMKTRTLDNGATVASGAWEYVSAMSLKAAQSFVLRIGLGVTGIVPVDELKGGEVPEIEAETSPEEQAVVIFASPEFEYLSEDLAEELETEIREANELEALSWPASKVGMRLGGQTEEVAEKVLAEIRAENERRREEADEEADEVADAEIVAEPIETKVSEVKIGDVVALADGGDFRRIEDIVEPEGDELVRSLVFGEEGEDRAMLDLGLDETVLVQPRP